MPAPPRPTRQRAALLPLLLAGVAAAAAAASLAAAQSPAGRPYARVSSTFADDRCTQLVQQFVTFEAEPSRQDPYDCRRGLAQRGLWYRLALSRAPPRQGFDKAQPGMLSELRYPPGSDCSFADNTYITRWRVAKAGTCDGVDDRGERGLGRFRVDAVPGAPGTLRLTRDGCSGPTSKTAVVRNGACVDDPHPGLNERDQPARVRYVW